METTHKEDVKSASDEVNGQSMDELDPWNPPYPPCRPIPPDLDLNSYAKLMCEWFDEMDEIIATSRRTKTIIPDRTPQVVRNRTPRGWELKYARRSFFPYWRSVLVSRLPCKVTRLEDMPTPKDLENFRNKSAGEGSSLVPDVNLGPLARIQQSISQPKRTFCSAALALSKIFRNA